MINDPLPPTSATLQLPPPPRPVTPAARRQASGELPVRAWTVITAGVLIVILVVAAKGIVQGIGDRALIREGVRVTRVAGEQGRIAVEIETPDGPERIEASDLLIVAGRKANVADLGLEAAGIRSTGNGIKVNAGLRTRNRRVYAIGDVVGGPLSSHAAAEHAEVVLWRTLFRLRAKAAGRASPRVVFTEPELAQVGLSETEARAKHGKIRVLRWPYHENDRAQAERETDGHIKVVTSKRGEILGAGIVGAQAGELIQMWVLAISQGLKIKAMTEWVSPYPTLSEINKRAAFRYFATSPSNPYVRKVIALLAKLG